jgi:hypothetical protein
VDQHDEIRAMIGQPASGAVDSVEPRPVCVDRLRSKVPSERARWMGLLALRDSSCGDG